MDICEKETLLYIYVYASMSSSPSSGVHPLRMTTTSSSALKVGLTVAEEANA